ncbi:MAG: ROK family protein, partial [Bacteroidales bacterium]|nr:ROK family protein [Bacteroidales bacterium]
MEESILVGVDVGGTKCAVTLGIAAGNDILIKDKAAFPTTDVEDTLRNIRETLREVLRRNGAEASAKAIGISCGGPLDSARGV